MSHVAGSDLDGSGLDGSGLVGSDLAGSGLVAIEPAVRNYDWGSPTAIPHLLGVEPTGRPVAELWFGAHPDGPSVLAGSHGRTLADVVHDDPAQTLGQPTIARFGPRLPFLLKVLAADRPLSLQVHPSVSQARAGFARQLESGVPASSPNANYRDDNHKPELLCALTDFWALNGFRPLDGTAELLEAFGIADLAPLRGFTPERPAGSSGVRDLVDAWLTATAEVRAVVIAAAVAGARRVAAADGAWQAEARWCLRVADAFPGDAGIVLALLLNLVHLRPGQFVFVPSGQVHSYLQGTGIEIMANSDNVLRCGLTSKRVDVAELMSIADFSDAYQAAEDPLEHDGGLVYQAPVEDFRLSRFTTTGTAQVVLPSASAQIVLCVQGELYLTAGGTSLVLPPGRAAFAAAGSTVTVTGSGSAFRAATNLGA